MYTSTADAAVRLTGWGRADDLTGKTKPGDHMNGTATTTLSSKGQVVIPEEIRERLGLKPGAQFVVIAERDVVIFKVLGPPSLREFSALVGQARQAAKSAGLRRADITKAVSKVRRSKPSWH
jgi:AbrB family looped-hinge helix DNA binding protein